MRTDFYNIRSKLPSEFHVKCETIKCPNYYNIKYKNANGYCKPCSDRNKKKKEA